MRHIEGVVPCAALVETRHRLEILALAWVERFQEAAVSVQRPQGAEFRAVVVLVLKRLRAEAGRILCMSEVLGKKRKRIVGYIIFKCMRYRVVAGCVGRV
jgi:hypothetical protein